MEDVLGESRDLAGASLARIRDLLRRLGLGT